MLGIERDSYHGADGYRRGLVPRALQERGCYRNRIKSLILNLNPLCGELGISSPSPCSFYPVLSPPEIFVVLQTGSIPHSSSRTGRILKIQCLDLGSLLHHALSPSIPPVWSRATALSLQYALPGRSFICLFYLSLDE